MKNVFPILLLLVVACSGDPDVIRLGSDGNKGFDASYELCEWSATVNGFDAPLTDNSYMKLDFDVDFTVSGEAILIAKVKEPVESCPQVNGCWETNNKWFFVRIRPDGNIIPAVVNGWYEVLDSDKQGLDRLRFTLKNNKGAESFVQSLGDNWVLDSDRRYFEVDIDKLRIKFCRTN